MSDERVSDPADPQRCQGRCKDGQCMKRAREGSEYCRICGFNTTKVEENRLYHLTEARNRHRLAQLTEHSSVDVLNEALSLARRLKERLWNLSSSDADFFITYGELNTLTLTVERLSKSANLIGQQLAVLTAKPTVYRLGQIFIQIACEELIGIDNYDDVTRNIADETINAIVVANNSNSLNVVPVGRVTKRSMLGEAFRVEQVEDQIRLAELSKHERIKSLDEDIALQVILVERRWNLIKNDMDLVSAAGQLNAGLRVLEKLVKSAHDIEQSAGQLLSVETLQHLGQRLSQILVERLESLPNYEAMIDRIMEQVVNKLTASMAAKQIA